MWEVWYDLEAANYLADNGSLVADLFFAVEALAESDGWPPVGNYYLDEELIIWQVVGHLVIYQRFEEQQIAQIAVLKPN